ncbi:MAG: DPP IV N-terminal domain-containing protein, partial [Acidimicrobiia bacterium]
MRELSLVDVARYPLPGVAVPDSLAFSPSGKYLTYLHSPDHSLSRRLFLIDVEAGETTELFASEGSGVTEDNLSLEEKLRRERARDLGLGVTTYAWASDADVLLVPFPDAVRVWRDGEVVEAVRTADEPALDPRLSPDGSMLAFVRGGELFTVPTDGSGKRRQLTRGAGDGLTHGLAEFVAQEEMHRSQGYWWSLDATCIAYTEVDERHIPVYRIVHQGSDAVGAGAQEDHRYPFAGADNVRVRLFVAELGRTLAKPIELDLGDAEYLARVNWLPDGSLVAQLQNRTQNRLELVRFDLPSGERQSLFVEESPTWINLHDMFRPLADGRFLWASQRGGHAQLEIRTSTGELEVAVTAGEEEVLSVEALDEDAGLVWYLAAAGFPLERHLYEARLDGRGVRRITNGRGLHSGPVSATARLFVDSAHDVTSPPQVTVRPLAEERDAKPVVFEPDPRLQELEMEPPEFRSFTTADGAELHAALYVPAGEPPYPVVLSVYGGPGVNRVYDGWNLTVAMRAQYLRQRGFLVVACDNRGGVWRGKGFEDAVHRNLGDLEVRDQVEVVEQLVASGLADRERVGIYGWSYGGYLAAMCLARAPEVFRAAVAGAPVTHWDGYDTHYTERYMGTPADNPDGYETSSVMHHASSIRGRLLLVHGLIDENVHFRHTARLINALIKERIPYELMLFPNERHSPRSEDD